MIELNFKEKENFNSQQTLVRILRNKKYYFKPISEYSNEDFYCMVKCEVRNMFFNILHEIFGRFGFKEKVEQTECPISFLICGEYYNEHSEPIIFTREDVKKIIMDVPENYVGDLNL